MSKKYYDIAVGWWKTGQDGEDFVSAAKDRGNPKKGVEGVKLFAELPNGDTVPVENFAMRRNKYKKEGTDHPDVKFFITVEE